MLPQRDGWGRSPLHVAVVMSDALAVMELLPLGVPTQTRDIRGLPPPSPPDTAGSSARTTSTGRAGQWVVLKRVPALVPYDTADPAPSPSARPTQPPSSWSTRAAGPAGAVAS